MRSIHPGIAAGLAAACLLLAGPAMAGDKENIEAAVTQFEQAANSGDPAGLAEMYTDDAWLLPPGAAMVQGKGNIENFWKSILDIGLSDIHLTSTEIIVSGNTASEVGTVSYAAGEMTGTGKYIVLWVKSDDGAWRLHRDIWNEDAVAE